MKSVRWPTSSSGVVMWISLSEIWGVGFRIVDLLMFPNINWTFTDLRNNTCNYRILLYIFSNPDCSGTSTSRTEEIVIVHARIEAHCSFSRSFRKRVRRKRPFRTTRSNVLKDGCVPHRNLFYRILSFLKRSFCGVEPQHKRQQTQQKKCVLFQIETYIAVAQ